MPVMKFKTIYEFKIYLLF